jgi:hypothetical protein
VAFQPEVMVWPLGSVKARDQPLTAFVPVLVMVRVEVSPVFQALTVSLTRQLPAAGGRVGGLDDGGADVGGGEEGGIDVGGGEVGVPALLTR